MPRGDNLKKINYKTQYKPLEDVEGQKLYDKVFGVRLPIPIAKELLKLSTRERTKFLRQVIIDAVENAS